MDGGIEISVSFAIHSVFSSIMHGLRLIYHPYLVGRQSEKHVDNRVEFYLFSGDGLVKGGDFLVQGEDSVAEGGVGGGAEG